MFGCKGLSEITMNVSITKNEHWYQMCSVKKLHTWGWGKLNVVLHTPPYREDFPRIWSTPHGGSVAVTVCDHAVNLHLEEDLARYFGNHSSTDGRRSLGFTTSSFKHFVNPCMHLMHHMLAPHASHACTSCITCFYQGCRIFKFCTGTTTVWDWDF